MKPRHLISTSAALADYLADREGLTGAARVKFLHFIGESLGFHRAVPPGSWQTLLVVSVLVGGASPMFSDRAGTSHWGAWIWGGCSLLGVVLALALRGARRRPVTIDQETHWRVYCLLLRPAILAEKQGLLDRNEVDDRSAHEKLSLLPVDSLLTMIREGGADLWWSSTMGLWCGMLGFLLVTVYLAPVSLGWAIAVPVAGLAMGPVAYTCGRNMALGWALRARRR